MRLNGTRRILSKDLSERFFSRSEIRISPERSAKKRVLSGMRPTGKLHLGNYMGALYNWVKLQHEYESYFFIADYHALTTDYADTSAVAQNTLEVAMDFLAAGLDPEQCAIFVQSHVVQHAELHLLLSMITSLGWLERVPSYKEQQENITGKDLTTYGFLGYPLLQSADILVYQAHFVPVGQDQAAHVELTREIARRFNQHYSPIVGKSPLRHLFKSKRYYQSPKPCSLRRPSFPEPTAARCPRATTITSCSPIPNRSFARSLSRWSPTRPGSAAPIRGIRMSARLAICIRSFQAKKRWPTSTLAA